MLPAWFGSLKIEWSLNRRHRTAGRLLPSISTVVHSAMAGGGRLRWPKSLLGQLFSLNRRLQAPSTANLSLHAARVPAGMTRMLSPWTTPMISKIPPTQGASYCS
jgi:hypothetical protein